MCVHLEQSLWTRFCTLQILEFSLLLLYHLRASNWTAYYLSGSESAMFVWDVISPVTWPCLDVNECAEQPGICGIWTCVNKDGNFSCICPDGHIMLPDGHTCMGQCSHSFCLLSWDWHLSCALFNLSWDWYLSCSLFSLLWDWPLSCSLFSLSWDWHLSYSLFSLPSFFGLNRLFGASFVQLRGC